MKYKYSILYEISWKYVEVNVTNRWEYASPDIIINYDLLVETLGFSSIKFS